ncbi:MAG: hypothetical protein PHV85_07710, partial [Desulfovibrionaceae bacterium]|nr:hypothetical protein [Desulfovibrionaceae bacterium]
MIKTAAIAAGLLAGLCLAGGQAAADGLSKVFEAREVKVLELRGLPGKIEILPSADGRIHLDLSGDSESVKRFKVESRDGRLVVTGPMVTVTGSSTTVTASHGSVTNVVIGSGQATVNVGGGAVQAVSGDVQTRILAPPGLELKASFTGTMVTDLAFASI